MAQPDDPAIILLGHYRLLLPHRLDLRPGRIYSDVIALYHEEHAIVRARARGYGHVPTVQVGQQFDSRYELILVGLHTDTQRGICIGLVYGFDIATCVVARYAHHNYIVDGHFIYGGEGGQIAAAAAQGVRVLGDQGLTPGNLALFASHMLGYSVRLVVWVIGDDGIGTYIYLVGVMPHPDDPVVILLGQYRLLLPHRLDLRPGRIYSDVIAVYHEEHAIVRARARGEGHVPTVQVGQQFDSRYELILVELHTDTQRGICIGLVDGADASTCVVALYAHHNYIVHDHFIYGGEGGQIAAAAAQGVRVLVGVMAHPDDPVVILLGQYRLLLTHRLDLRPGRIYSDVIAVYHEEHAIVRARARGESHVPTVQVGAQFDSRYELILVELHTDTQRGICIGLVDGADASTCVVALYAHHNYIVHDHFIYGGEGGQIAAAAAQGVRVLGDQGLTPGNLALIASYMLGYSVRLVAYAVGDDDIGTYVYVGLFNVLDFDMIDTPESRGF